MVKLIVVIMGPGKKHFAEMCLDSIKDADEILYWTSDKKHDEWSGFTIATDEYNAKTFYNDWDETDPATNGKCRQRYLKHLKENYPDDWCLVIDEDEIVEDLSKIKEFIQIANPGIYNVKMRHFIGDLGHEDATHETHFVPGRLFKIDKADKYPEHSHPVLEGFYIGECRATTIWHLGHLPVEYMDYILKRYKQHATDSIIHPQDFLHQWKMSHLFGQYPARQINPLELPQQICDRYEIDKDEFYHSRYGLELKHPMMVQQWNEYFKPNSVLDLGCGRGCYLYFWKWFVPEEDIDGVELSQWAVENSYVPNRIRKQDITKEFEKGIIDGWDLVTCVDLLEHIKYEELDSVLRAIKVCGKQFLFSIPFRGDPNLDADPTHIIKEDKDWWIKKLSKYFTIKDAPKDWLFHEQILIGEKK